MSACDVRKGALNVGIEMVLEHMFQDTARDPAADVAVLHADSAEKGNHFSGVKVASQLVAERGEGRVVDVGSRRGTGIPRTWQRWTAAAGSNS
jgi:hypothetical protein